MVKNHVQETAWKFDSLFWKRLKLSKIRMCIQMDAACSLRLNFYNSDLYLIMKIIIIFITTKSQTSFFIFYFMRKNDWKFATRIFVIMGKGSLCNEKFLKLENIFLRKRQFVFSSEIQACLFRTSELRLRPGRTLPSFAKILKLKIIFCIF